MRRLERAQRRHPTSGWVTLYLGDLHSQLRPAEAIDLYSSAIGKFVRLSDPVGEAEAHLRLGPLLFASHRREEAWREAQLAQIAARRSGDSLLVARSLLDEAELAKRTGERLGRGVRALKEAKELVFPDGPYALKQQVLRGLGKLSHDLGRYDDARSYYAELIELARDHGDKPLIALAAYSSLTVRRKQMEELPEPERLPELTADARDLLRLADATGQSRFQAMAHRTLGDLLWGLAESRNVAVAHYRAALAYARGAGDASELSSALWALGRVLAEVRPDESRSLIDEALVRAVDSGSATTAAYAWRQMMRLAWKTRPRERAAAESIRALDAIEAQRTLQEPGVARAAVLGAWTSDYHWLIGALLHTQSPTRAEVTLAFAVAERMRARLLLESLLQSRHGDDAEPAPVALVRQRHQQLLERISAVQRRLLDPRLQGSPRVAAETELERLERAEEETRAEVEARQLPPTVTSAIASLDAVERALREDEAMLSFSVGVGRDFYGKFAGGAWLLVSVSTGTRAIQLPDRPRLHAMLSVYQGLAEEGGAASELASVKLYEILFQEALRSLPSTIRRLILVPDGALHHLPFAALRPAPGSAPLGVRYELLVAPSASVWMRLRAPAPSAGDAAVLVLADPVLPRTLRRDGAAEEREWSAETMLLGDLPYSRVEGRSVVSHVGAGSRLLAGMEASEAFIKSDELRRFTIVHFATHALVDDAHPDRSAVILADDAKAEDGLLQAREIAGLPLAGRVVVLSACRSATGAVLAGEGVLGLSRAFFEAGARTVIGTLWDIRDDHAASLFDAFYESLARGRSIGAAMLDARRAGMQRGLPMAAWSSIVVIGDDSLVPLPRAVATSRQLSPLTLVVVGTLLLAAVMAIALRRSGRGRNVRVEAAPMDRGFPGRKTSSP